MAGRNCVNGLGMEALSGVKLAKWEIRPECRLPTAEKYRKGPKAETYRAFFPPKLVRWLFNLPAQTVFALPFLPLISVSPLILPESLEKPGVYAL